MASLQFTASPFFSITLTGRNHPTTATSSAASAFRLTSKRRRGWRSSLPAIVRSYKVVIEHEGQTSELEVEPDETILSKALHSGLDIPHDCKLGVCMTCPARLLSGSVDQSEGMLSDDVRERGYALLCVSYPQSDCLIRTIPDDEVVSLQLVTAND